ncbi:MAG: hypothetical protein H3C25_11375 [Candidatus Brocadia sapporoensis]|nr:hypothetical protein [Candidatus Brocadia sapporoensis]QQR67228.1 MAG: hypothetical protein IPI25_03070 [Candidatus Brocadia sp.]
MKAIFSAMNIILELNQVFVEFTTAMRPAIGFRSIATLVPFTREFFGLPRKAYCNTTVA